jgi:hypothetical protein
VAVADDFAASDNIGGDDGATGSGGFDEDAGTPSP